jgi:lipoprotein-anchoring transpeptidase ErfK/SrfK
MVPMTLFAAITTSVLLIQTAGMPAAGDTQPTRPAAGAEQKRPAPRPSDFRGARSAPTLDLDALRLQVALDRAGFSPGALDGRIGANTKKALAMFNERAGGPIDSVEPLTSYTVTSEDAAGPFVPEIPKDLIEQANLPSLSYRSVVEALAERFHTTPALLQQLNPQAQFTAGDQIQVPNVEPLVAPVEKPEFSPEAQAAAKRDAARATGTAGRLGSAADKAPKQPNTVAQRPDVTVTISKSSSALDVTDAAGRVIFYAPVTTGSEYDPLPIGEWKVNGIQFNPPFNYNPELFWDANPSHSKAKIPSGPNNPVGLVWIDLSKEHYGIHGTPEPTAIGRTESHGCVRLTNWDALKLAGMIKPGTKVVFTN